MKSDVNNPNLSLPYHIRGAFRGFETALGRTLATKNLPLSHFHILRLQWYEEGYTQKDIADKAFMTESVTSQVIKNMVKGGLLDRKADRSDARKKRVYLTQKGLDLRESILVPGIETSQIHAPDISREDINTTMEVLIKIRLAFDAYNAQYTKENN